MRSVQKLGLKQLKSLHDVLRYCSCLSAASEAILHSWEKFKQKQIVAPQFLALWNSTWQSLGVKRSMEALEKFAGRKFTASELLRTKLFIAPGGEATRIVYGPLTTVFDIDYAALPLAELREVIELALLSLDRMVPNLFKGKSIRVYEGGNHLDIINEGVGTMGWLTVEDHVRAKA